MKKVIWILILSCIGVPVGVEIYSSHKDEILIEKCSATKLGASAEELINTWGLPAYKHDSYEEKSTIYNYDRNSFFSSGPISFTFEKERLVLIAKTCEDIW